MMVCVILGKLTKFCTYGFQFMFQVILVPRERARAYRIAHTIEIPCFILTLILIHCFDEMYELCLKTLFLSIIKRKFWDHIFGCFRKGHFLYSDINMVHINQMTEGQLIPKILISGILQFTSCLYV